MRFLRGVLGALEPPAGRVVGIALMRARLRPRTSVGAGAAEFLKYSCHVNKKLLYYSYDFFRL